ncbi:unnamed protein product [Prunus armeniaca]|uniref:F-box associated domain-containing protein n=1 Tax=Prunus armeniaca TaxID=36596 RepID=A0A6J5WIP9_PRUAR|nr:unnamed protein product [Prunus armeniaca]
MEHSFGRYNPDHKVWEQMTSFPFYDDYDHTMQVTGYAVCYGIILFSLSGSRDGGFGVVAFRLRRRDWNRVKIDTSAHGAPPFEGRAVVVDETIYALSGDAKIKAFSFMGEKSDVNVELRNYPWDRGILVIFISGRTLGIPVVPLRRAR